jgi:trehalose synthase
MAPSSRADVQVIAPGGWRNGSGRLRAGIHELREARENLSESTVWHINSTATGGGVAELIRCTLEWHERAGLRCRWLVPAATPGFFDVTKQLHHRLHGSPGSGTALGPSERLRYADETSRQAAAILNVIGSGDLVVLHDPQTLGLAPALVAAGRRVAWRCHIGTTSWSAALAEGWDFLGPYLLVPTKLVFSAAGFIPPNLRSPRSVIIHPAIDPGSTRCRPMDARTIRSVLAAIRLEPEGDSEHHLRQYATVIQDDPLPRGAATILQLSRWDPLKDMAGVLLAFATDVARHCDAHLVLAGPDPDAIPDDPENAAVLRHVVSLRDALPTATRARTHLVMLALSHLEANAVIVNALQRRATLVVQKSLQEGFGMAVTEAMWKRRPLVASAVGGILEQVVHGRHGLLVRDPSDLDAFSEAVLRLLRDVPLSQRLASMAHSRCRERFLAQRELHDYAHLYMELLGRGHGGDRESKLGWGL